MHAPPERERERERVCGRKEGAPWLWWFVLSKEVSLGITQKKQTSREERKRREEEKRREEKD